MADKVSVRRVTVSDLAEISALCSAHAAYEIAPFNPKGHAERLAVAISGTTPRAVLMLAEVNGHAVGYASICREFSTWTGRDFLHMDCLFVSECRRGQGIGRQLFDAVLDEAKRGAVAEVQWQTPEWNTNAIQFYRAMGAVDATKARFVLSLP
jgi:ribosomal protein S18 acetylase RimI-like enzyme